MKLLLIFSGFIILLAGISLSVFSYTCLQEEPEFEWWMLGAFLIGDLMVISSVFVLLKGFKK